MPLFKYQFELVHLMFILLASNLSSIFSTSQAIFIMKNLKNGEYEYS